MRWFAAVVVVLLAAAAPANAALVYQRTTNDRLIAARDDGSQPRVIARPNAPARDIAVSPNGRWVAYLLTGDPVEVPQVGNVFVVPTRGGRPWQPPAANQAIDVQWPRQSIEWSSDGRRFIAAADTGTVWVVDPARHRRVTINYPDLFDGASISPDGSTVAVAHDISSSSGSEGAIAFIDVRTRRQLYDAFTDAVFPEWGVAGMAYSDAAGVRIGLRHVGPRTRRPLVTGSGGLYPLAWSRRRARLLVAEGYGRGFRAWLVSAATNTAVVLPTTFDEVDDVSADGRRVLGVVGGAVVSVTASGRVRVLARHARSPSWSR